MIWNGRRFPGLLVFSGLLRAFALPAETRLATSASGFADDPADAAAATCTPNTTTLCLNAARFKVTADWAKSDGSSGHGTAIPVTADTGYFWFFSSSNIEVVTKVIGFCADPFNSYWVFAAGLTNVKVTLTYTDTRNGTVVTKENPLGKAFEAVQDTSAFRTCP